jgi:hypothetical protein
MKESSFLTAKTSAMVCWLFVGSGIFSAAFALLGGQELIEKWVLSLNMTPLQFMILAQFIIFILGWPLEWTEIIIIFMPIFIPLLPHFGIDPLFFGLLVALNLQTAFLSPPVAMAAFYLKGVSPAARDAEPDLRRHDAFHGHPDHRADPALHVPADRAVAAERHVCAMSASLTLSAAHAAQQIRDGKLTSEELIQACLERIRALEPQVQAWTFLDEEHALGPGARAGPAQARTAAPWARCTACRWESRTSSTPPTCRPENGTALHKGRTPRDDAAWSSQPCVPQAR